MSEHRIKTTFQGIRNHRTSAFAVLPVVFAAAALGTLEASASPWEPDSAYQPAQVQTDGWPDEGSGYPGYGDPSPMGTVPDDWPDEGTGYPGYGDPSPMGTVPDGWPDEGTGYPGYADQSSPTGTGSNQGLDTTSVALGALGGIALGGAGLGITLVVQRRRDHVTLPTA
jgi:hypothetical protein